MNIEKIENIQWTKVTSDNIKIIDFVHIIEETTRLGDLLEFECVDPCDFEVYREMWIDYGYEKEMEDIENDGLFDFGIDKVNEFIDELSKELKR